MSDSQLLLISVFSYALDPLALAHWLLIKPRHAATRGFDGDALYTP